jgi:predicted metal-dependent hydrolase
VLVHELAHVLEASHIHRFKAIMDRFMPKWRALRQELRSVSDETSQMIRLR